MQQYLLECSPKKDVYPAPERYQDHLLEQYKLYVQMTDNISQRRHTSNAFFLTANTVLVSMYGFAKKDAQGAPDSLWLIVIGICGVIICGTWYELVRSYRGLNAGKFTVIHSIERMLPMRPYYAEWQALGQGKDPSRYKPFTHIETSIPFVFAALYLVFTTITLIGKYLS